MKVENMTSSSGNEVANQFIITDYELTPYERDAGYEEEFQSRKAIYFQSYSSIIAKKLNGKVYLDRNKWDYSTTTGKYRNIFLGETKKETQKKIDSGEYILADLN